MPGYPSQVVANGEPAQNLYAYDAAGNRLEGVRVFDQSGRALFVGLESLMGGADTDVPMRPDDGSPDVSADVFPLTWPGHDAWQDPGFGWTPPLTLPPLAGATGLTGPSAGTPRRRVPLDRGLRTDGLTERLAEPQQHALAGARHVGEEQRGRGHGYSDVAPVAQLAEAGDLKSPQVRVRPPSGAPDPHAPVEVENTPRDTAGARRVPCLDEPHTGLAMREHLARRTSTLVTRAVTTPP